MDKKIINMMTLKLKNFIKLHQNEILISINDIHINKIVASNKKTRKYSIRKLLYIKETLMKLDIITF